MFAASKTASVSGGYQISRSLRFNSADSAYLNRTPATTTNRRTWTWSAWVKRSALGAVQELFDGYWANTDNGYFWVGFTSADAFEVQLYNSTLRTTTQVFRDPSAWYHLVLAIDTTQATAANRVKVYLNGSEITTFSTNNAPTQNLDTAVNYNGAHYIGTFSGSSNLFNGYMTEINLIDGTQLTPSSFGETNAQTGVWQPKAYSGSYGTNGFYLNFSDNSNTTAATLGKDYSGNGNNWTPNGFLVTAGAGNDSLVDVPTSYGVDTGVGGTVRGNYCTLNPLFKAGGGTPAITNGNLDMTAGGTGDSYFAGTTLLTAGKWYYEATITAVGSGGTTILIGACRASDSTTLGNQGCYRSSSEIYNLDGTAQTSGATYGANDVIGVAIDIDNGTVKFYKNNTGQGATNSYTFTAGTALIVRGRSDGANPAATFNFGQRPFAYTAPSGFKALCTQNLPTPTIGATTATQAGKYFNTLTYTGNGTSGRALTGVGFQPDFTWIKQRSSTEFHNVTDAVRGAAKTLFTNGDFAEQSNRTWGYVSSFDSDGFTVTQGGGGIGEVNGNGSTYAAWNWKANGSGSTNTSGSITSTVSANTTSGFSIVTYTGTGANATVGHGLGVTPSMVIVKRRNSVEDWQVRHISIAAVNSIELNLTGGAASSPTTWNSTNPTSTVFSIGTDTQVNASGGTYVAYCFAPIAGYSSMGSYVGNGSTDGPFIFTGMRPAFVLVRRSDGSDDWYIFDSKRIAYNVRNEPLYPNGSYAEGSGYNYIDLLSNGFKMRNNSYENISGANYIYAAFAENPFKYSLAR